MFKIFLLKSMSISIVTFWAFLKIHGSSKQSWTYTPTREAFGSTPGHERVLMGAQGTSDWQVTNRVCPVSKIVKNKFVKYSMFVSQLPSNFKTSSIANFYLATPSLMGMLSMNEDSIWMISLYNFLKSRKIGWLISDEDKIVERLSIPWDINEDEITTKNNTNEVSLAHVIQKVNGLTFTGVWNGKSW